MDQTREDHDLRRATALARWLDIGLLDPLLGLLLPGLGDLAASFLGLYLVKIALQKKLPAVVIARMLLNLAIDALVGGIPFLGDLFDFAYRANLKNLEILKTRHEAKRYTAGDIVVVFGAGALLLAAMVLPIAAFSWVLSRIFR